MSFTDVEDWLRYGYQQGWCGPMVCSMHDGIPAAEDEYEADGCVPVVRLYEDAEIKAAVEADHPPSVWRASNAGL